MKEETIRSKEKGITLIALIVTIIVILILAAVSISTLTGEEGILSQAEHAKTEMTKAETREKVYLEVISSFPNGKYNVAKAKENLETKLGAVVQDNGDGTLKVTLNGYEFNVNAKGKLSDPIETEDDSEENVFVFNPETLTIGEAVNTAKYGYKANYTSKYETDNNTTIGWRLFYQDSNYAYLIADTCVGSYKLPDYYTPYDNGSSVSTVGQKLNPMLLADGTFFVESNTNMNMKATAFLTDTEYWSDFQDNEGKAVFAIASPTLELYAASFNATASLNNAQTITLGITASNGYTENAANNQLQTTYNNRNL